VFGALAEALRDCLHGPLHQGLCDRPCNKRLYAKAPKRMIPLGIKRLANAYG
jgi:hypothetical protein